MVTAAQFMALNPIEGVRYSSTVLGAYGRLDEHGDTHGEALWVDDVGEVFADEGIVEGNTYYGRRTAPYRVE